MREVTGHEVSPLENRLDIFAIGPVGSGGDEHHYIVCKAGAPKQIGEVKFQEGSPSLYDVNGLTMECLIQINIDRLESLQKGPFPSDDNQEALVHLIAARECLHNRTRTRLADINRTVQKAR